MRLVRILIISATLLVVACGDGHKADQAAVDASLPGVYSGTFPCQNCPGIDVTLWLRPDRSFFIKQQYLGDTGSPETTVHNLGRWAQLAGGEILELRGAGPTRSFDRPDRDSLAMRTHSKVEHRLLRDQSRSNFTSTIAMSGMMHMRGENVSFAECYTGLKAPVQKTGDFARFQRQYRNAARVGEAAFVEFEGRFVWSGDGSLRAVAIENFKTIKDGLTC